MYPRKIGLAVLLCACAAAQSGPSSGNKPLERRVQGRVLTSNAGPAVEITLDKAYKYIGGQRWDLYSVADAEQHLFVKPGKDKTVERFYWVQFEHYLPNNQYTYDYPAEHTTKIGGLDFV